MILASLNLILRSINSIDLRKLRPYIIIRDERFYQVMNKPLISKYSTRDAIINVGGSFTGER